MEQEKAQSHKPEDQQQPQTHNEQLLQQLAMQQAMLQQLATDQRAMWQHMQAMQERQGQSAKYGSQGHAEGCEHHDKNAQQAEHFMRMAEKFRRGEMSVEDVAGSLSYLNTQSGAFWTGLLIGGGVTLLFSNETIRESITGLFKNTATTK